MLASFTATVCRLSIGRATRLKVVVSFLEKPFPLNVAAAAHQQPDMDQVELLMEDPWSRDIIYFDVHFGGRLVSDSGCKSTLRTLTTKQLAHIHKLQ